jgi:hypothetical protein
VPWARNCTPLNFLAAASNASMNSAPIVSNGDHPGSPSSP